MKSKMPRPSLTSIEKLLEQFITYRRSLNHSVQTLRTLRHHLLTFLQWLGELYGITAADPLRKTHLHAYQNHLYNRTTFRSTPLTPGSINNSIKALRSFMGFLYQRGYLSVDLREQIVYVKQPKILPTSVLDHVQMRDFLTSIYPNTPVNYRNRTIMEIFYSCGIRSGELLGLSLSDIYLDQGVLTVMGKGQKQRVVPIGKTALRFCEGYIKGIRPFWKNSHSTQALFLNQYGKPLRKQTLERTVSHCFGNAPVRVTPHTFRRSCTTELIRGNANLYHVKDFLGHSSLDTLAPYTKLTINDLKKTHAKCHPREKDE